MGWGVLLTHPFSEQLKQRLEERPAAAATTLDVLRDVIATSDQPDATMLAARRRALAKILTEDGLPHKVRARWRRVQLLFTESIAEDLGAGRLPTRSALVAATTEALAKVRELAHRRSPDAPTNEGALRLLEEMLNAVRNLG